MVMYLSVIDLTLDEQVREMYYCLNLQSVSCSTVYMDL